MSIKDKRVAAWKIRTPVGYDALYTRMTEDATEVAAVVQLASDPTPSGQQVWTWIVTSDAAEVGRGEAESSELARFKADLMLSDIVANPNDIRKIFTMEELPLTL